MTSGRTCGTCGAELAASGELAGLCPACLLREADGSATRDGEDEALERVRAGFPELDVEGVLGRGGMGVVYAVRQRRLDREAALKVLAPEVSEDPAFAERFLREARAMARLAHANVVTVYDFGEVDGRYFLLMERVQGVSLRELLARGPLDAAQALAIVPQICAGLQYAHERGVVHRDVKPENVLVDTAGRVKLVDFGLAKLAQTAGEPVLTRTSQVMGTPHYMAPEQLQRPLEVDHRADIYALGVVFYEMLTGELPLGRFEPPSHRARLDVRLDEIVLRALEREPERRYQAASDVGTDLERVARPAPDGSPAAAPRRSEGVLSSPGPLEPLVWPGRVPGGPILVGWWGAILAWGWLLAYTSTNAGPKEWAALAYPFAFVGLAARGPGLARPAGRVLLAASFLSSVAVTVALCADPRSGSPWYLAAEAASASVLVLAHLLLDRWVRRGPAVLLGVALAVLAASTVMHASAFYSPASEASFHASGMGALICASSGAVLLPELARRDAPRELGPALLRAFGLALLAAAVFFRRHLG